MANALTNKAALNNLFADALDTEIGFYLRTMPVLDSLVDFHAPKQGTNPGSTVVLQVYNPLTPNATPLNENTDVDAVAVPNTTKVNVTVNEYGNAVMITKQTELFNIASGGIDSSIVHMLGDNMADVTDLLVKAQIDAAQNVVRYNGGNLVVGGTANAVTATDTIKSDVFRRVRARMIRDGVRYRNGTDFLSVIHPDVSADLRAEVGEASWRDPMNFQDVEAIRAGSIGRYEGFEFIENARLTVANNGSGVPVYRTHFLGAEAIAKVTAEAAHAVVSPVVDRLERFKGFGWTGTFGYGIYRQPAIWNLETASKALV